MDQPCRTIAVDFWSVCASIVSVREGWTFLTNHAVVLLAIDSDPDARLRDLAEQTHLTERAVFDIVDDLCTAGYVTKTRIGRRVHYDVHPRPGLRHRAAKEDGLQHLLDILRPPARAARPRKAAPRPR